MRWSKIQCCIALTPPAGVLEDTAVMEVREQSPSMVVGMATRKVTITLEEEQINQIRKLVDTGRATSMSGFVQHAVAVALDDVAGWGALLAEALRDTGGPLTDDERAWADGLLGSQRRRRGLVG